MLSATPANKCDHRRAVSRLEFARGTVTQPQSHQTESVFIVLEGAVTLCLPDRVVTLRPYDVVQIPARVEHHVEALAPTHALKILLASSDGSQCITLPENDPDHYLWGV